MTDVVPGQQSTPSGASATQRELHGQLAALAEAGEAGTRALLEVLRGLLKASAIGLVPIRGRSSSPEACIITSRGIPAARLALAAERLTGQTLVLQAVPEVGPESVLAALPLLRDEAPVAWLLAVIAPGARDLPAVAGLLHAVSGFLLYREERQASASLGVVVERMSELLDLVRRVGAEEDFAKASRMTVDTVQKLIGCQRVALVMQVRGGLKVSALSGIARVDTRSAAHQPLESVAREAFVRGEPVDVRAGDAPATGTLAHEVLIREAHLARVMTLPFPGRRGALVLEWKTEPDQTGERLARACAPILPALSDLMVRARPNGAIFAARRWWQQSSGRRRQVAIIGAVAVVLLLLVPLPYRIGANCRVAPTLKRVIAAPFDGQFKKAHVRPGDRVREGQVLAEMDNRELRLLEAELVAQRERAIKQRDRAMSNSGEGADFATAQVADFEARSVGEELALVQQKIALLEIRAPLDGVVLSGDLRRDEGRPVSQGFVLFEVAPLEQMIVEIEVPDREISRVRPGMKAQVRLEAGDSYRSEIGRVHPQAEGRDGKNVFIAEAAVSNAGDLRPGMHGRAKVQSDLRPVAWILLHRLWDWLVALLWW